MFSFFYYVPKNEIPERIPATMTLEEYKRLKEINSKLGAQYQDLDRRITLDECDYFSGLRQQEELLADINKVRKVLRHFEKEMTDKYGVNSGLDEGKQVHVSESQGLGPFYRVTLK